MSKQERVVDEIESWVDHLVEEKAAADAERGTPVRQRHDHDPDGICPVAGCEVAR